MPDSTTARPPRAEVETAFTPETLELRAFLERTQTAHAWSSGDLELALRYDTHAAWLLISRASQGGVALRAAPVQGPIAVEIQSTSAARVLLRIAAPAADYQIAIETPAPGLVHHTVKITPRSDLLVPFLPRDLYPLDSNLDPTAARGWVEAAQRGYNTGLCYFCMTTPAFGTVLYVQDLTRLNAYFDAARAKPDGVVGGKWPELGYQPPTAPLGNSPPVHPLQAGRTYVLSHALLAFDPDVISGEQDSAAKFLTLLATIYAEMERPALERRDWPALAPQTLESLRSAKVQIGYEGAIYLRPYVDAEYPDCMVQATLAAGIAEYEAATGRGCKRSAELVAGMRKFYDPSLQTLRRYLPNVGDDKDRAQVDSWYLYHPLLKLAELALRGSAEAGSLLLDSLDYAIRAARHFDYKWPIMFNVVDFRVLQAARDGDGHGQTDVGGLYAALMVRVYDLTGDARYLHEARAAIEAACGLRFELVYQTNLTAWGAWACWRLAAEDGSDWFRAQAQVYVAGFLHNCEFWNSEIEHARHYKNFLGATCLHDGPYMAAFECFDSFAAFDEALRTVPEQIAPHIRAMLTDYCRYALDRAWYYFPAHLPEEALAKQQRNGHIDPTLALPLEDLYGDGQCAGQVGQETYGAAMALVFAARAGRYAAETAESAPAARSPVSA